ncbi:hypothetical protein VTN77DRAFT_357 [Rasamsonia byssochlamydoides]|uniref:uncharacterized protein n=1 Tax=Rasamsonia byssochlamydoides TaxID=89139 RepID=UPI0037421975
MPWPGQASWMFRGCRDSKATFSTVINPSATSLRPGPQGEIPRDHSVDCWAVLMATPCPSPVPCALQDPTLDTVDSSNDQIHHSGPSTRVLAIGSSRATHGLARIAIE